MEFNRTQNGSELIMTVSGRIDTTTAPQLEAALKPLDGITSLIFDFANLAYISSAGLRVLLATQKVMNKQGKMVVRNVSEEVGSVFEVTGFSSILTIE